MPLLCTDGSDARDFCFQAEEHSRARPLARQLRGVVGQPLRPTRRRDHVLTTQARRRRATPLAGDDARLPHGAPAANKGMRYPADPPRVEEIVAVMRQAGDGVHGDRARGLIVVLVAGGAADRGGA